MKNNTSAIEQFITIKGNVENLLAQLTTISNDHLGYDPDNLHWGHVGTFAAIQKLLEEAAEMAGIDTSEILDTE